MSFCFHRAPDGSAICSNRFRQGRRPGTLTVPHLRRSWFWHQFSPRGAGGYVLPALWALSILSVRLSGITVWIARASKWNWLTRWLCAASRRFVASRAVKAHARRPDLVTAYQCASHASGRSTGLLRTHRLEIAANSRYFRDRGAENAEVIPASVPRSGTQRF